jgi:hypothetical protein
MIRVEGARPQLPRDFRSSKKMPGRFVWGAARQSQETTRLLREQPQSLTGAGSIRKRDCND